MKTIPCSTCPVFPICLQKWIDYQGLPYTSTGFLCKTCEILMRFVYLIEEHRVSPNILDRKCDISEFYMEHGGDKDEYAL